MRTNTGGADPRLSDEVFSALRIVLGADPYAAETIEEEAITNDLLQPLLEALRAYQAGADRQSSSDDGRALALLGTTDAVVCHFASVPRVALALLEGLKDGAWPDRQKIITAVCQSFDFLLRDMPLFEYVFREAPAQVWGRLELMRCRVSSCRSTMLDAQELEKAAVARAAAAEARLALVEVIAFNPLVDINRLLKLLELARPPDAATLALKLGELDLSPRVYNCLRKAGIGTIGQLVERSPDELQKIGRFGIESLREVVTALDRLNLSLASS